jgi:hypothetical protein
MSISPSKGCLRMGGALTRHDYVLVLGDLGIRDEHAEYAFLYVELEVEVTAEVGDLAPYEPLANVT